MVVTTWLCALGRILSAFRVAPERHNNSFEPTPLRGAAYLRCQAPIWSDHVARALLVFLLIAVVAGCASTGTAQPERGVLTPAESKQVDLLLSTLYKSFNYGAGAEPDWASMRSVFVEGAQFVSEAPIGQAPEPKTVDQLIADWQASMRKSKSPTAGYEEWITGTNITKAGRLIFVDVTFQAREPSDRRAREPGRDALVLTDVGGTLKVLSFVVQYESKLQVPGTAPNTSSKPTPLRGAA